MTSRWSADERQGYIAEAERGNVSAQMWLGWAYWEGKYIETDLEKSEIWLERAASTGLGEAKYRLALFHKKVTHRHERVADLLQSAIEAGCNAGAYELGNLFLRGLIVEKSQARAVLLWQQAAKAGHVLSEVPLIKTEYEKSSLIRKPLIWLKLIAVTAKIGRRYWNNPNDPSILGAPV